ncbi:hypothetical protein [Variovorax atrisoli]|uniref:hypothetical protein n=1 Tax=Variovorax atrisoli TaxID=3394203 RepID=UPI00403FF4AA
MHMRGCITLRRPRILGARLHIHWSALVAAGVLLGVLIRQPLHAFVAVATYFLVILLHEAGHALVARRLGYPATDIYLTFIHGVCVYEQPGSVREAALVAWGGVLVQLVVAIPLIVLAQTTPLGAAPVFPVAVAILGYMSLFIALLNLAPARGLDGALAWKLVPILLRDLRNRFTSKKKTKDLLRRIK